jgi:hypothetical protein
MRHHSGVATADVESEPSDKRAYRIPGIHRREANTTRRRWERSRAAEADFGAREEYIISRAMELIDRRLLTERELADFSKKTTD